MAGAFLRGAPAVREGVFFMKTLRRFSLLMLGVILIWPAASGQTAQSPNQPPHTVAYRIGPDDVLRLAVWDEPRLNLELRVRPDGFISVPLIQDVRAAGLTPVQLAAQLKLSLSHYIRDPNVSVIVQEINSIGIYVVGEVNKQGVHRFSRRPNVLQVLAECGGLTQYSQRKATIVRKIEGSERRQSFDLRPLLSPTSQAKDPLLEPGDVLIVR